MNLAHTKCACWLVVVALAFGQAQEALSSQVSAETNQPGQGIRPLNSRKSERPAAGRASGKPVPPEPATAYRLELPTAFRKPVPTSIADLKAMEEHNEALFRRVSPAVVAVEVGNSSGSGIVVSADGLILTAGHVCGAPNRRVRFSFPDGQTVVGKTLGLDDETDVGLMRITDLGPWPYAKVGELEHTSPGDWVLALGHPGGFDSRRSLVVRLGRIIRMDREVIQTDCTITLGDSGGPLFDMHGRVIGIHSAISSSVAANFHVPVSGFSAHWAKLVELETTEAQRQRPSADIGATVTNSAAGCQVVAVARNGPAFKAGLKVGDLVLRIEGRDVKVAASFQRWVAEAAPGETLTLEIRRGAAEKLVKVKLSAAQRRN